MASLKVHKPGVGARRFRYEWAMVEQWLGMAAGLRFVDVEFLDGRDSWLCSAAGEYNDAYNSLVSAYATEQSRLLYVWSAMERLLRLLVLPDGVPEKYKTRYSRAAALLSESYRSRELPEHYSCIYRHLRQHIENDAALMSDRGLTRSMSITSWRTGPGLLLAMGNAMRNIPAHGADGVPTLTDWDRDNPVSEVALSTAYHAPMLATRGLLLSIQMLLAESCNYHLVDPGIEPSGGTWIRVEGQWVWVMDLEPVLREALLSAHLTAPSDDEI